MQAPRHTAIIMDGNGRWATTRGYPRSFGHRRGARAVDRTVRCAPDLGIETLTLYAFSSDNWRRPEPEISALMDLLERFLRRELRNCAENGVRISVIGRRDRLRPSIVEAIAHGEHTTLSGGRLHLRLAIDYSSRASIVSATGRGEAAGRREAAPSATLQVPRPEPLPSVAPPGPDVDLLIRTGGEKRLSDFLLWESAYAELYFTDCLWPDFDERDLAAAVADFQARHRRFGGLPAPAAGLASSAALRR